jgi:hypothetical protein
VLLTVLHFQTGHTLHPPSSQHYRIIKDHEGKGLDFLSLLTESGSIVIWYTARALGVYEYTLVQYNRSQQDPRAAIIFKLWDEVVGTRFKPQNRAGNNKL